jgi:catechol 2,3-dioxygenase-like lactoylglutathione lyase family enzyme
VKCSGEARGGVPRHAFTLASAPTMTTYRVEVMAMLNDTDAAATIAVKDLNAARRFYQNTLGLTPIANDEDEVIVFKSGKSVINVYRSQYAGTNQATVLTWIVGDQLEDIVQRLKAKGITFEHYDMPNTTLKGDVHVAGNLRVAWFKDPDGNILNLASG